MGRGSFQRSRRVDLALVSIRRNSGWRAVQEKSKSEELFEVIYNTRIAMFIIQKLLKNSNSKYQAIEITI